MDFDELEEHLKCPVCFNLPEREIYQCRNGHILCGKCGSSLRKCPQCRVYFPWQKVRVLVLEGMANSIKVDCPYKEAGCDTKIKRADVQKHLETCIYNGNHVKFCDLIGYNCEHYLNTKNVKESVMHLEKTHNYHHCRGTGVAIKLLEFAGFAKETISYIKLREDVKFIKQEQEDKLWNPVIVTLNGLADCDSKFIILTSYNRWDASISWLCLFLNHETSKSKSTDFEAEFLIQSKSDEIGDLRWKARSVDILKCEDSLKWTPFRVDIEALLKYFTDVKENCLVVQVAITKLGKMGIALEESKFKWLTSVQTMPTNTNNESL